MFPYAGPTSTQGKPERDAIKQAFAAMWGADAPRISQQYVEPELAG
jgi:hypothetical protein